MQPIWFNPAGSYAQVSAFGIPLANFRASGLAFHGRRYSPMTTSSTSVPSGFASDHRQQYPAVSLAENPSRVFPTINDSSASGDSTSRKSNPSSGLHTRSGAYSSPSVLFTHSTKASDPA